MQVESFPVGPFQCNCSILADEQTATAVIVDPGDEADRIVERIEQRGLTVAHIVHTHAHIDHVGASADVKARCGGKAWLHREDTWLLEHLDVQAKMLGGAPPAAVAVDQHLEEGDRLTLGGAAIEVLHTPGHTPGSCTFVTETDGRPLVFSGDTLFRGGIGRTDLWGGDTATILESLKGKLLELDDEAEVICGHGPPTTIGRERRSNPFLTGAFPF